MTYLQKFVLLAVRTMLAALSLSALNACGSADSMETSGGDGDASDGGKTAAENTGGEGGNGEGGTGGNGNACPGPDEGVLAGNSDISGIAPVDTFFASVVGVDVAAQRANDAIWTELDAIAVSLGLAEGSDSAEIRAALQAKLAAHLDGGLAMDFQPVQCTASAADTLEATVNCDASVDSSVSVHCEGSCEAEVDGEGNADCSAEATLICTSMGAGMECEGTCVGACELEVPAACEGTCQGTCSGTCSIEDTEGSCNGPCDGDCDGTCVRAAGDECAGTCLGECTYSPPSSACQTGSSALCRADVASEASVECADTCEGRVVPPSASAECEASAKADAELAAECAPPPLDVVFQFSPGVDANARTEFIAWLDEFEGHYSALLAATAKADVIVSVAADLSIAASGPVRGSWEAAISGDLDLDTTVSFGCALVELEEVAEVVTEAATDLQPAIAAGTEVVTVAY